MRTEVENTLKKKWRAGLIAGAAALLTAALAIYLINQAYFPGDLAVTRFWQSLDNPIFKAVMLGVSFLLGTWQAVTLTALCVGLVFWRIGRSEAVLLAVSVLCSLTNYLFKALVARPRPDPAMVRIMVSEPDYSFPSTHALLSVLLYGALIFILVRHLKSKPARLGAALGLGLMLLLTGTARVYLGVHWYSDVIGGYLTGTAFLFFLIWGFYDQQRSQ